MKQLLQSVVKTVLDPKVLLVVIAVFMYRDCTQKPTPDALTELQALREALKDDSSTVKVIVAEDSTSMVHVQALEASNSRILEELFNVKAINKKFGTEIKDVKLAMQTRTRDTVYLPQDTAVTVPPEYTPDSSAHTLTGIFNNPWYMAKAVVSSNPSKLPGSLSLVVKDSVTYLFNTKRSGSLFNRREDMEVSITHANPYIKEVGVKVVRVPYTNKPKKWGIGVQAGMTIIPIPQPYLGIGVTRTFIRF